MGEINAILNLKKYKPLCLYKCVNRSHVCLCEKCETAALNAELLCAADYVFAYLLAFCAAAKITRVFGLPLFFTQIGLAVCLCTLSWRMWLLDVLQLSLNLMATDNKSDAKHKTHEGTIRHSTNVWALKLTIRLYSH